MFKNLEGQKVPEVTFQTREKNDWKKLTSADIFKGKKVILFALPGAFTPTCSSTHLPRYNDLVPTFKQHGVDEVYCLSVNDTFVMNSWAENQEAENIKMIPDGNGEFSDKMGLLVEKNDIGFGKRSWRYSMLVNDGVIEKMFIEPVKDGDPFEVSDADTMLNHIAPDSKPIAGATIFTKEGCPHCTKAKNTLEQRGINYTEIKGQRTNTLQSLGGSGTFPLVFLAGNKIGGADELETFFKNL